MGLLGVGGMGEVYRARDPRLQREVALKIVHPSLTITPEHIDRFSREARAAGSLHHPNILVVFDVGVDNGVPYVISELLEGESLRDRLDRGPVPYRKALDYGIQMAQALGAAHAKGIWHRDVKPANTFITSDGRIKLLDFGLAKLSERISDSASDETTADASKPGLIRGTAGYMSPEQARAERVDHRTDLFSLGAILYEMFTSTRAFQRASTVETLHAVLREEPADPLEINPALPLAAAVTVRRCLEKSVDERFQSARDLAFQLQQLRDGTLTGRPAATAVASWRRRALLAAMFAVAALGVAWAIGHLPQRSPSFEQLTFRRGRIGGARFASEGQAVIYSEAGDRNHRDVWRLDPSEGPKSRALPRYAGAEVLATRKGELALSLDRRFVGGKHFVGKLATAPIDGDGASPRGTEGRGERGLGPGGQGARDRRHHRPGRGGEPARVSPRTRLARGPVHPMAALLARWPPHRVPGGHDRSRHRGTSGGRGPGGPFHPADGGLAQCARPRLVALRRRGLVHGGGMVDGSRAPRGRPPRARAARPRRAHFADALGHRARRPRPVHARRGEPRAHGPGAGADRGERPVPV